MTALDQNALLAGLPPDLAADLFGRGRKIRLAPGKALFLVDDPGDGCYRVDRGLLKASVVSATGGERVLGIFGPGMICGELSMIDGGPRSASVTAIRESHVVFLGRAEFDAFARARPEIYHYLVV